MEVSGGTGRYSATGTTEHDLILKPRLSLLAPNAYPPIIYCHGSTESPFHIGTDTGSGGAFPTMLNKIVHLGRWIFSADLGPTLTEWASATSMSRMTDLYNWSKTVTGWTGAKVHIMASSMGNSTAAKWAAANPDKVYSITGFIPVTGIQWCRDNNTTLRGQIDTIYGVTYPAALPAGADPFTDTAQVNTLKTIPFLGYSASDDTLAAPLANTNAWAAIVGGESYSVGALGHTDAAQGAPDYSYIVKFMATHGG